MGCGAQAAPGASWRSTRPRHRRPPAAAAPTVPAAPAVGAPAAGSIHPAPAAVAAVAPAAAAPAAPAALPAAVPAAAGLARRAAAGAALPASPPAGPAVPSPLRSRRLQRSARSCLGRGQTPHHALHGPPERVLDVLLGRGGVRVLRPTPPPLAGVCEALAARLAARPSDHQTTLHQAALAWGRPSSNRPLQRRRLRCPPAWSGGTRRVPRPRRPPATRSGASVPLSHRPRGRSSACPVRPRPRRRQNLLDPGRPNLDAPGALPLGSSTFPIRLRLERIRLADQSRLLIGGSEFLQPGGGRLRPLLPPRASCLVPHDRARASPTARRTWGTLRSPAPPRSRILRSTGPQAEPRCRPEA